MLLKVRFSWNWVVTITAIECECGDDGQHLALHVDGGVGDGD